MKSSVYIYSVLALTFLTSTHQAQAVVMKGNNLRLETELFNTFTKDKIIVEEKNEGSTPQTQDSADAPQLEESSGTSATPSQHASTLNISLTPDEISFGTLTAGEPIQRSIRVTAASQQPFTLHIAQSDQLTSDDIQIPDTSCDSGTCTPGLAAAWTSPLTYGFGYTCAANVPCTDFPQEHFKPLPNLADNMSPRQFLASSGELVEAELTFKVNIPPTNAGRTYSTNITIYSLPNY